MFVKIIPFVWVGLAVLFLLGEIFTEGFALMWFGIGCAVGALLAFLKLPFWIQILAAIVVSSVLFALSRVFFKRVTRRAAQEGIAADRMIGKTGVVIERIDPITDSGLVRVAKEEWRADSENEEPIEAGTVVKVIRLDGVHVVVKPKEE
jgi:membrane protein implicated in regulation of membrane protease activity